MRTINWDNIARKWWKRMKYSTKWHSRYIKFKFYQFSAELQWKLEFSATILKIHFTERVNVLENLNHISILNWVASKKLKNFSLCYTLSLSKARTTKLCSSFRFIIWPEKQNSVTRNWGILKYFEKKWKLSWEMPSWIHEKSALFTTVSEYISVERALILLLWQIVVFSISADQRLSSNVQRSIRTETSLLGAEILWDLNPVLFKLFVVLLMFFRKKMYFYSYRLKTEVKILIFEFTIKKKIQPETRFVVFLTKAFFNSSFIIFEIFLPKYVGIQHIFEKINDSFFIKSSKLI